MNSRFWKMITNGKQPITRFPISKAFWLLHTFPNVHPTLNESCNCAFLHLDRDNLENLYLQFYICIIYGVQGV